MKILNHLACNLNWIQLKLNWIQIQFKTMGWVTWSNDELHLKQLVSHESKQFE
jgi:hypothetical protein